MVYDEEAIDILSSDDPEYLRQSLFKCAWTSGKLCRGWYDAVKKRLVELGESAPVGELV